MHVELCWSLQGRSRLAEWLGRAQAEHMSEEGVCWVQELMDETFQCLWGNANQTQFSLFPIYLKVTFGKKSSFVVLAQLGSCCFPELSHGQCVPAPDGAVGLVSRNIGSFCSRQMRSSICLPFS